MSTTTSPFRPRPPRPSHPFTPISSTTPAPTFTPTQRDRQARGKDPYRSDSDSNLSDDEPLASKMRPASRNGVEKLDFSRVELRHRAVTFLENPELLMMWAQSKGDSVAGARLHFTRMLCGYEKPEGSKRQAAGGGDERVAMGGAGGGRRSLGQGGGGGSGSGGKGKGKEEKRRDRARG